MILMVPGTISTRFQKSDPWCGPKLENVLTLFTILGPNIPRWALQTKHYLGLRNFSGNGTFFKQYQGVEYFSHSIFSLEFDYECRIQKLHHTWNLQVIIWNSGTSLNVAYFLPKLKHCVSIKPNLIILYSFGISLDL